jgi:hypothetical protein
VHPQQLRIAVRVELRRDEGLVEHTLASGEENPARELEPELRRHVPPAGEAERRARIFFVLEAAGEDLLAARAAGQLDDQIRPALAVVLVRKKEGVLRARQGQLRAGRQFLLDRARQPLST